ncbi:hypothetical protein HYPSUDRAFT_46521 [Hypholoma sublateritium FD-334 SS-4]|uniref:F-box domain-containing protein n=1 Tax=Hypholoma sublateritium (strain FD-334 SS-4) TaxID=945553 RepID=A0A0D2PAH4_HYPSF|nr:hypothetical protein HYPSUDRAFT_46521 [Hypholoma sublateritium FD-334 SS-4]
MWWQLLYDVFYQSLRLPSFVQDLFYGKKESQNLPLEQSTENHVVAPTLQSLPAELCLHIFSFLELQPYIVAHGVCSKWRYLLSRAEIHPIRRRLFNLYHHMINTPGFLNTRGWTLDNLVPFNRQAYIDSLLSQYPAIPEDFRIWILEWPARLSIGCTWPGLPFVFSSTRSAMRRHGVNWLGHKNSSPQVLAALYKRMPAEDYKFIPGLIIWRGVHTTDWLILDETDPDLFGRVYVIDLRESFARTSVIPHNQLDPNDDYSDGYEPPINIPFDSWISYLENYWNTTHKFDHHLTWVLDDRGIPEPVEFLFDQALPWTRPSPLWTERHNAGEYLG